MEEQPDLPGVNWDYVEDPDQLLFDFDCEEE